MYYILINKRTKQAKLARTYLELQRHKGILKESEIDVLSFETQKEAKKYLELHQYRTGTVPPVIIQAKFRQIDSIEKKRGGNRSRLDKCLISYLEALGLTYSTQYRTGNSLLFDFCVYDKDGCI